MPRLCPLSGGSVAAKQQHGGSSAGGWGKAGRCWLSCHYPPPPGGQERTQRHHQVRLTVRSSREWSGLGPEPALAACVCFLAHPGIVYSSLKRRFRAQSDFRLFVWSPSHIVFSSPLNCSVTCWLRRITSNAHVSIAIETTAAPHNGKPFQELLQLLLLYFLQAMSTYFEHPKELCCLVLLQQLPLLLVPRQIR